MAFAFNQSLPGRRSSSISASASLGLASLSLKNQPSPVGSELTSDGSSTIAWLTLDDLAGKRAIDIRCGLDRFNGRGFAALLEAAAGVRQFDKHQVAELFGGMGGDADSGDIAIFDLEPFVVFGEFEHGTVPV
jgi:hypothetical protein